MAFFKLLSLAKLEALKSEVGRKGASRLLLHSSESRLITSMRRELTLAPVLFLTPLFAIGQETAPATLRSDSSAPSARYAGPGIIAPEMLSPNFPVSLPKHCNEVDGVVRLSAVVDANGTTHDVKTLRSDDPRLSNLAIELVSSQRFKPGTDNGTAVEVAIDLTVGLHTARRMPNLQTVIENTAWACVPIRSLL
jgi:hypothetical protein